MTNDKVTNVASAGQGRGIQCSKTEIPQSQECSKKIEQAEKRSSVKGVPDHDGW